MRVVQHPLGSHFPAGKVKEGPGEDPLQHLHEPPAGEGDRHAPELLVEALLVGGDPPDRLDDLAFDPRPVECSVGSSGFGRSTG